MRRTTTQQEWLTEDIAQIRRYFPGAKIIKALHTPFDLHTPPQPQQNTTHTAKIRHYSMHKFQFSENF